MVAYAPTNTVILTDSGLEHLAHPRHHRDDRRRDVQGRADGHQARVTPTPRRSPSSSRRSSARKFERRRRRRQAVSAPRRVSAARSSRRRQAYPARRCGPPRGHVRIITDERTNSLIVLASRQRTAEIRDVVARSTCRSAGGGRIHVYYLKHADAEELANTLSALLSGQSARHRPGGRRASRISGGSRRSRPGAAQRDHASSPRASR